MYATFALLALLASTVVANPVPQAVTSDIAPAATAPAGCVGSAPGTYVITIANASSPAKREVSQERNLEPRVLSCGNEGTLIITLNNGVLHDAFNRVGYVAANRQFQFDGPPQAGAIYTAGFSICGNNSLALGGSTIFYQCLSGTFYNLYDQSQGGQCSPAYIQLNQCVGGSVSNTFSGAPATTSAISSTTAVVTPTITSSVAATSTTAAAITSVITSAFPGGPIVSASNASTSAITTAIPGGPIILNTTTLVSASASTTTVLAGSSASSAAANSTVATATVTPSSSGGGSGSGTPSSTASSTVTASTGAADVLAAGKQLVGLVACVAALFNMISSWA